MSKKLRKPLSWLLALCMILSLLPMSVFAVGPESQGTYEASSFAELWQIYEYKNGKREQVNVSDNKKTVAAVIWKDANANNENPFYLAVAAAGEKIEAFKNDGWAVSAQDVDGRPVFLTVTTNEGSAFYKRAREVSPSSSDQNHNNNNTKTEYWCVKAFTKGDFGTPRPWGDTNKYYALALPKLPGGFDLGGGLIVPKTFVDDEIIGNGEPDYEETKYTVTYTDGVDGEEIFADEIHRDLLINGDTPAFTGETKRDGYVFAGWNPEVAEKVKGNVTYEAQWTKDDSQTKNVSCTVEYYLDGVKNTTDTISKQVWAGAHDTLDVKLADIKSYEGYVLDYTYPQLPADVPGGSTIKVYYDIDSNHDETADKDQIRVIYSVDSDKGTVGEGAKMEQWLTPEQTGPIALNAPQVTGKEGLYEFTGWSGADVKAEDGYYALQTYTLGQTYTLTAEFKALQEKIKKIDVTIGENLAKEIPILTKCDVLHAEYGNQYILLSGYNGHFTTPWIADYWHSIPDSLTTAVDTKEEVQTFFSGFTAIKTIPSWDTWTWKGWLSSAQYVTDVRVDGTTLYITLDKVSVERTVDITITVDTNKGTFTDSDAGSVSFANIPEFSTEQYKLPKVEAKEGYKFTGWKMIGKEVTSLAADAETFVMTGKGKFDPADAEKGTITIEAVFESVAAEKTYTVHFSISKTNGGNYIVDGKSVKTVDLTATYDAGRNTYVVQFPTLKLSGNYKLTGWKVIGRDTETLRAGVSEASGVESLANADDKLFITAMLKYDDDEGGGTIVTKKYEIDASAGKGGDISPKGTVKVNKGANKAFTITADKGYKISDVLVDGESVGKVSSYTFKNVQDDHTIEAIFAKLPTDPDDSGTSNWLNTKDHFAYMNGYPDSTFGPNRNMTRAEVAQMFYALLLDKDVTTTVAFSDVPADAWYAKAVNTLASLGMVTGYPDGTFHPDASITRAEFATIALAFAYELKDADCNYYDVPENAWFYTYVAQATTYGWIGGSNGYFRPNDMITRAEVSVIVNNMLGRAADEDYVDKHEDDLVTFPDVKPSYWAYYSIMETVNDHEYTKDNGLEDWK